MGVTEIMGSATESVYQQNKSREAATEKSANNTNTVENAMEPSQGDASELQLILQEYRAVKCGDKTMDEVSEKDKAYLEQMLKGLTKCSEMECFHTKEDMERASELYAYSIQDGKVHVECSKPSGYFRAKAYEDLLNASV